MSYVRYRQANFGPAYTGLATVGYQLVNADGTIALARTTSGVAERGAGTGSYGALVTHPAAFTGEIRWDTGGASPVYASEDVNPGRDEYADAATSTRSTYAGGPVASVTGNVGGDIQGDVSGRVLGADYGNGWYGPGVAEVAGRVLGQDLTAYYDPIPFSGPGARLDPADPALPAPLDAAATALAVQTGLTDQGYTDTRAGYLDALDGLTVPSVADIVTGILNILTSAATVPGSLWLFVQQRLGLLTSATTVTIAPTNATHLVLYLGSDYTLADGGAPSWNGAWSPASITALALEVQTAAGPVTLPGVVTSATGTQGGYVPLTQTQLAALGRGRYAIRLKVTTADNEILPPPARGTLEIRAALG